MSKEGKKCVIYSRVSTEMQVDGFSLAAQRTSLLKYVSKEEMICVKEYEDAGKSGKSIEGRPAFKRMIEDIEEGLQIDYVIVYKLSRFGRNAADVLVSLEKIKKHGVNLICCDEGIDSSQSSGKLLISLLSAVAEIERENILEQSMNGRCEKARQGLWNGGPAPYGYKLENNKLIIEPEEAEVVKMIYNKYINENMSFADIAKYLNNQGIKRQNKIMKKDVKWLANIICFIIDNPVYCGKIAYVLKSKTKAKETLATKNFDNNKNVIIVEGQHEPIISKLQWEQLSVIRKANFKKLNIGKPRLQLLSGIVKCPICGSPLNTNRTYYIKTNGKKVEHVTYICGKNKSDRLEDCKFNVIIPAEILDSMALEILSLIVNNNYFLEKIKEKLGEKTDDNKINLEIQNYEKSLTEENMKRKYIEEEILNMAVNEKHREKKIFNLKEKLNEIYDKIENIESMLEDSRIRKQAIDSKNITQDNIKKILSNFNLIIQEATLEEKRKLISVLISEIKIEALNSKDFNIKSVTFNFPIPFKGNQVQKIDFDENTSIGNITKICTADSTKKLNVDIEIEEENLRIIKEKIDQLKPKKAPTYKEIKQYVLENYGIKANDKYITYVKYLCNVKTKDYPGKHDAETILPFKVKDKYVEPIKNALIALGAI